MHPGRDGGRYAKKHGQVVLGRKESNIYRHINCLEALAAFLAIKCFARDKHGLTILLRMDNITAVTYVNKLGGTVSQDMNNIVKEMWLWCMKRDITLEAEHLPGVLNTVADEESRVMKDNSDWMLNPTVFSRIQSHLGLLEVDMFASRLTTQLPRFFSWRPDPEAEAVNAFSQDWRPLNGIGYANPPWVMINRVWTQVQAQKTSIVLVAPVWKAQPWYPKLLEMLINYPQRITMGDDALLQVSHGSYPAVVPQLAVWNISGEDSRVKAFQRKAQSCCSLHRDGSLRSPTTHSFGSGVTNGIPIPFSEVV